MTTLVCDLWAVFPFPKPKDEDAAAPAGRWKNLEELVLEECEDENDASRALACFAESPGRRPVVEELKAMGLAREVYEKP